MNEKGRVSVDMVGVVTEDGVLVKYLKNSDRVVIPKTLHALEITRFHTARALQK